MRRLLALSALFLSPLSLAMAQGGTERSSPRKVAVFLYPGVELLDFAGPGEVFAAARDGERRAFEVFTVAESTSPLRSQRFVDITPRYDLKTCPPPDIVVIPGGGGVPMDRPEVVRWLIEVGETTEVMFSVCNGALLLAKTGLLDGLHATTHHGSIEDLMLAAPNTVVHDDRRFVDNGRVVTAAGVSAGIDGALQVVSRLLGEDAAARTARYMEYRWEPEKAHDYQARVVKSTGRSAQFQVVDAALKKGVAAAKALLEEMSEPPAEMALNRVGYALLRSGRQNEGAIVVFELIAAAFPESANAWDSLADAWVAVGRNDEALRCARRCLELIDEQPGLEPDWRERVRESAQSKVRQLDPDGGLVLAEVGRTAPDFALRDIDGGLHRLTDHRGEVVVLEWTSDICPSVAAHYDSDRLPALQREFAGRVVWLSIDSSGFSEERVDSIRTWRSERGLDHPHLLDASGTAGRAFGATTTPEVFVIDIEGRLAYAGAVDAGPTGGDKPGFPYLAEALRAVLEGREAPFATASAVGCSIKYRPEQAAAAAGGVWKCPPCGGECHDRDYDRAGHCSGCGMRLITKAKYDDAVAAQTAARGTGR